MLLHKQRRIRIAPINEYPLLIQNEMVFSAHRVIHISWHVSRFAKAVCLAPFVLALNAECLLSSISSTVTGLVGPHVKLHCSWPD